MASKKTVELRKAKEKRQKMIAIGGAVILVAVLAIQVPKLMSHPGPKATSTQATTAASGAPATSATAVAVATPSTTAVLVTSDAPAKADAGQLVVFDHFQSKDPFVQQLSDQTSSSSPSSSTKTASAGTSTGTAQQKTAVTGSAATSVTGTVISPVNTTTTATTGKTVVISTNGVRESVQVGTSFPHSGPLFQLVSVKGPTAQIAVAGGSYADGSATVTLTKGKPLTLMDTNTNEKYVLVYVSG